MAALQYGDQLVITLVELAMAALEDDVGHMVPAQLPEQLFHAFAAGPLLAPAVQPRAHHHDTAR